LYTIVAVGVGLDERRMDLREMGWEVWTGFNWLRIWTSGNEPSGSTEV